MALGEAQVKITPDLGDFQAQLVSGINKAMESAAKSVDKATEVIEDSFEEAAKTADAALTRIDGDGMAQAQQTAERVGRTIEVEMQAAARDADQALSKIDGDDFQEVQESADKAAKEVAESFDDGAKKADNALQGFAKSAAFAAGAAAIGKFAKSSIDAFADLGETLSKAQVIFGDATDSIVQFGDQAATSMGQSKQAAIAAASDFAIFGGAAGLAGQQLATFSTDLTMLASDLASFSNTTPEEAVLALGAALRGESEPIRRYGVLLDDATLKARALEMGIYDGNGALSQQERVLAANAEIFAQTSLAQGDFARTSDSLSNSQKTLSAQFADMQVQVGQALAPAMETAVGIAGDLLGVFSALPEEIQSLTTIVLVAGAGFVTASKAIQGLGIAASTANKSLGIISVALAAATAIYSTWNSQNEEAEARQNALNDALVAAGDPMATLVDRSRQLADEFLRLNPATEEATVAVEEFAGAQAFVQSQLADNVGILGRYGTSVAQLTDIVQGSHKPFADLSLEMFNVGNLGNNTTSNLGKLEGAIRNTLGSAHPLANTLLGIAQSGELTNGEFMTLAENLAHASIAFQDQNKEVEKAAKEYLNSADAAAKYAQILGADTFQAVKDAAIAEAEAAGIKDVYGFALERVNGLVGLQTGLLTELTVSEEEAAEATKRSKEELEALAAAAQLVSDEIAVYEGRLRESVERTNSWRDSLRSATESGAGSFETFKINANTSIDQFIDMMIQSTLDLAAWQDNLLTIASQTSPEFAAYLAEMGEAGAPMVGKLVRDGAKLEETFEAYQGYAAQGNRDFLAEFDATPAGVERRMNDAREAAIRALGPLASDMRTQALAISDALMQGLVDGIAAGDQNLAYAAAAMANSMISATKTELGIRSPSQVFADEIGTPIAEGVALGITQTAYQAKDAMVLMVDDITTEALAGIDTFNQSLNDVLKTAEGAYKGVWDTIKGRRSQEAATERVTDAEESLAVANQKVTAATQTMSDALGELLRLEASGTATEKELTDARRNYEKAQRDVESAVQGVERATKSLEDANYALLQVSEHLLEQGPESVAQFEAIAAAAGLEAGEIAGLVKNYNDLAAARAMAAEANQRAAAVDAAIAAGNQRSLVDSANEAVMKAVEERNKLSAANKDTGAATQKAANAAIAAAQAFAKQSGAAANSRAFAQAQLDVLRFLVQGTPWLAGPLSGVMTALQRQIGLANGAIVNGPRFAMIGEAGPEAVIPLGRPQRAMQLMEESGLADMVRNGSGAMVNIQSATFATPSDADLVAQKVNAAYRARVLVS